MSMLRKILLFTFTCVALIFSSISHADIPPSPVGNWLTIDDETGQPRSIVQISINNDDELQGKIIKVYYRPGEGPTDTCKNCTDPEHKDKVILGMTMLWGMHQSDTINKWVGGNILDPVNGKIYRCQLILSPNGQNLVVHGYIGIPLIGRSQNWVKVDTTR